MNSRERITLVLNHKEADRVPIDFGGTNQTGITKGAHEDLIHFIFKERNIENLQITSRTQQLVKIDKRILEMFDIDTIPLSANIAAADLYEDNINLYFKDEWGIEWKMPKINGFYFDVSTHPLQKISIKDIEKYNWPDPGGKNRYYGLKARAKGLYKNTDKAIIALNPIGAGILELSTWLAGFEDFFIWLVADKKKAYDILNKITDIQIEAWSNYLEQVGEYISVCATLEDLGSQMGPLISLDLFRKMIFPLLRRRIENIKKKTNAKVFLHSCGDISKFIPLLIEAGIDILNPIQVSASNMGDTAKLKNEYGKDLVFWGAGCDSQKILPFGSTGAVEMEVKRRIKDLAKGGGFIFAPIHNIQYGVPPENIITMFKTALKHGNY
jgi:uroporphyrinogen decarboxylase